MAGNPLHVVFSKTLPLCGMVPLSFAGERIVLIFSRPLFARAHRPACLARARAMAGRDHGDCVFP